MAKRVSACALVRENKNLVFHSCHHLFSAHNWDRLPHDLGSDTHMQNRKCEHRKSFSHLFDQL